MSIWATSLDFDADDHDIACARWVPDTCAPRMEPCDHNHLMWTSDEKRLRRDDTRPCTCRCGPLVYRGSGHRPGRDGTRSGSFDVAYIPGHITPDGGYDEDNGPPWEFLRVRASTTDGGVVLVLDGRQVTELHRHLGWLLAWRRTGTPEGEVNQ